MLQRIVLILLFSIIIFSCTSQNKKQMANHTYTNNLINETSPYLLQHAHNPVDWHPWNEKTLALAKKENKLMLISVGYAACHWCHVMEHESFEDTAVANIMNQNFINIKVDREERPDVDQIYMNAVQLMTGSGGWPLNCVALPDGRPVWGGTYFPKENWIDILEKISKVYRDNPEKMEEYAEKLTEGIKNSDLITINKRETNFSKIEIDTVVSNWEKYLDFDLGGSVGAPKFPTPTNYEFLLRYGKQTSNTKIMAHVNTTLTNMAWGGIYDQVGGGFARYSVDEKWHIPHFEKMLYDNGQLVNLYANAYLATKDPLYKRVVYQTTEFVERELTNEKGGFYTSLDADSNNAEGELEEGVFYIWSEEELKKLITDDFQLFKAYYNISSEWIWEHENYNLHRTKSNAEISKKHAISEDELVKKVDTWRATLLMEREKRSRPRLDDKVLTSLNALMLKGYINAYRVFDDNHFLEIALKNANFIINNRLREDGGLNRNLKEGKGTINAYLEDYATTIDAFLQLYQVTLDEQWLQNAKQLADYCYDHFYDATSSLFYFTSNTDPNLIARKIDTDDGAIPSSNSIMAHNLFLLGHYYGNKKYTDNASQMLHNIKEQAFQYGGNSANWLSLYLNYIGDFYEVAISGKDAQSRLKELNQQYIPNKLIVGSIKDSNLPLLAYKFSENNTTIYVCVDGACKMPVTETKKAIEQIKIKL